MSIKNQLNVSKTHNLNNLHSSGSYSKIDHLIWFEGRLQVFSTNSVQRDRLTDQNRGVTDCPFRKADGSTKLLHRNFIAMAAQLPDKILLNGQLLDLYTNPLEQYWIRGDKKRPRFITAPNCQRGYVAHWEIRDSQFLLTAIGGTYDKWTLLFGYEKTLYTLKTFMPQAKGKPVKAVWFSGKLRIPKGKMTMYEHQGYDSRFEQETIITIDRGVLTKMVTIDYAHKELFVNTE